jgi:hypothetical protein
VGVRAPIAPDSYSVRDKRIEVSYPGTIGVHGNAVELPKSLSTVFEVTWKAKPEFAQALRGNSFRMHLVIYEALAAISELLLAFKLVRIGHSDARGVRTIGIGDTLAYWSTVDGVPAGASNTGIKDYGPNNAWRDRDKSPPDPHGTTALAIPHIGKDELPLSRRFVRCFELLEHGFYSEAFIVGFSLLDDFVQTSLKVLLTRKGLSSADCNSLLRGIKEDRLRLYLGPVLRLTIGRSIEELWPEAGAALEWLNRKRNRIAHASESVTYDETAHGIFACLKLLILLRDAGIPGVDISVLLFRNAKITASWTWAPPAWVPQGEVAESMDFRS